MGIRTECQAVISCDFCSDNWIEADYTQKEAIKGARKAGWKVSYKQATCPKCRQRASAVLPERVKAGMKHAELQGKHIGRPRLAQKGSEE